MPFFLYAGAPDADHVDDYQPAGPVNAQTGVERDDLAGRVPVHDLVPVPLGHSERLRHGRVGGVEQRFDLARVPALDHVEASGGAPAGGDGRNTGVGRRWHGDRSPFPEPWSEAPFG
jgi:hypothetical protein